VTQKLICRVVWWPSQVRRFQREVNTLLMEGWTLRDVHIFPKVVRTVCVAVLESPEPVSFVPVA
jgi:hypothetical protein